MSEDAARGAGEVIMQLVRLSLLDLAGRGTALTQREALRDRIKQHVARTCATRDLSMDAIARALNCSRRHLYNAFADEADGWPATSSRGAWRPADWRSTTAQAADRSITEIALAWGFSNLSHFSRVFRSHMRRVAERLPARGHATARADRLERGRGATGRARRAIRRRSVRADPTATRAPAR